MGTNKKHWLAKDHQFDAEENVTMTLADKMTRNEGVLEHVDSLHFCAIMSCYLNPLLYFLLPNLLSCEQRN